MQAEQNNMMGLVFWQNISTFPLNNVALYCVALLICSFFSVVTTAVLHIQQIQTTDTEGWAPLTRAQFKGQL